MIINIWEMGSLDNNKSRIFTPYNHTLYTRTHQIGALLLVTTTFFLFKLFDQSFSSCHYSSLNHEGQLQQKLVRLFDGGRFFSWPERGYESYLSFKIYVYNENEIDSLKSLLYGRDGTILADFWLGMAKKFGLGLARDKIHKLLLQSRCRMRKKEEADLFFVPAYPKCVKMMGELNNKEINQTYVKVLGQMPYFRRFEGRDHIFVFPKYWKLVDYYLCFDAEEY